MRHRRKGTRLNRKPNQLKALLRNLVTSLILAEKMVTTETKAKALIPVFDRLVVKVRKNIRMNAIRELQQVIFGEAAQRKFLDIIVPALDGKDSGFLSLLKIGFRKGDNAPLVRVEILGLSSAQLPVEQVSSSEEIRSEEEPKAKKTALKKAKKADEEVA